ncbi:hypothetical protein [Quatrionicoccus australiensis]|uniref:hypothetical protein n=1 Tax=Quatrionicoccus australiensis TaxID=138118 RepID=UPI001CFC1E8C|nr:hypothetical protein [Quatrionicoccus australiensis]MCB4362081.1 hypothetical protein [Quatrionicoccus australiensis]
MHDPALNLAPFGRWTLRDEAAQRRLALRWAPYSMVIFESEYHLIGSLDHHDNLIRLCAQGRMSFDAFCSEYHDFYAFYALDGHESDEEERQLFEKYEKRIEPHRIVAEEILAGVCSDVDAQLEIYQRAGRFGSARTFTKTPLALNPGAPQARYPLADFKEPTICWWSGFVVITSW